MPAVSSQAAKSAKRGWLPTAPAAAAACGTMCGMPWSWGIPEVNEVSHVEGRIIRDAMGYKLQDAFAKQKHCFTAPQTSSSDYPGLPPLLVVRAFPGWQGLR